MQHLVDVLLRMDIQYVEGDDEPLTKDSKVRKDSLRLMGRVAEGDIRHDVAGGADREGIKAAFDLSGSGNVQVNW